MRLIAAVAALCCASPAIAQERAPFIGAHAGVEAGYLEHHFGVEFETFENGQVIDQDSEYRRAHGVGGGAFAGYDLAVTNRVRVGVELAASFGGRTNRLTFEGARYEQKPRFGVRGTLRAGYVITDKALVYVTGGYGGNRYSIRDGLGFGDGNEWGSSFILGGGLEHRASNRIGVRLDFKHVDNQTNQIFIGIPIRF